MATPTSIPADGNVKAAFVATIADPTAPTASELTAAGVVDLSLYLTGDGFQPATDQGAVTDPRFASVQVFEQPGRETDTLQLMYVYQGQSIAATDNKAHSTLAKNTTGYVVMRWGGDYSAAFAASDVVDVWPVKCGVQMKMAPEGQGTDVLKISQKMFVTDTVQRDVTVAA